MLTPCSSQLPLAFLLGVRSKVVLNRRRIVPTRKSELQPPSKSEESPKQSPTGILSPMEFLKLLEKTTGKPVPPKLRSAFSKLPPRTQLSNASADQSQETCSATVRVSRRPTQRSKPQALGSRQKKLLQAMLETDQKPIADGDFKT